MTVFSDTNTMVECVPFASIGKIQPFLITLSTNSAFLMDFHCHLTKSEVSGYLAGHWDVSTQSKQQINKINRSNCYIFFFLDLDLQVIRAFPCRCTKNDRTNARYIETEIRKTIEREKLTLVGWYHSHPSTASAPTLRDIDAQLDYQIKMKGANDNTYTPCVGIIICKYF